MPFRMSTVLTPPGSSDQSQFCEPSPFLNSWLHSSGVLCRWITPGGQRGSIVASPSRRVKTAAAMEYPSQIALPRCHQSHGQALTAYWITDAPTHMPFKQSPVAQSKSRCVYSLAKLLGPRSGYCRHSCLKRPQQLVSTAQSRFQGPGLTRDAKVCYNLE